MPILIIVRHGQSEWNLQNRFTGDVDVDLSPHGREEATTAGILLREYEFQMAFTSALKRAMDTLNLILDQNRHGRIPIIRSAALNERRYGDLQGMNKTEVEKKFGAEQFLKWRRGYAVQPPGGESLKNTYERVIPYYDSQIEPELRVSRSILVVAHGNSLRALMMYLEKISETEIENIDLATGVPRRYELDRELNVIKTSYIT